MRGLVDRKLTEAPQEFHCWPSQGRTSVLSPLGCSVSIFIKLVIVIACILVDVYYTYIRLVSEISACCEDLPRSLRQMHPLSYTKFSLCFSERRLKLFRLSLNYGYAHYDIYVLIPGVKIFIVHPMVKHVE